jgi:hypothetical protein
MIYRRKRMYEAVVQEEKLLKAEKEVAQVQVRAERVSKILTARIRRNHWGETIDSIIKNRGVNNA